MKKKVNIFNIIILSSLLAIIGYLLLNKKYNNNEIIQCLSESSVKYIHEAIGKDYWQTTKETEFSKSGDCEDMALLLYSKLEKRGYNPSIKIGILGPDEKELHMWVELKMNGREYILEATSNAIFENRDPTKYISLPNYLFLNKFSEWEKRENE